MNIHEYILGGCILAISIFLIIVIMLQESNSRGLASMGGGSNDSFYSKNKSRTYGAKLARLTKISAGLLMILSLVLGFICNNKK